MITEQRALARLQNADLAMRDVRRKIYQMRAIVAGDPDALTSGRSASRDAGGGAARKFRDNTPDLLVKRFEEGRNNDLLNLLGVLVEQTCYYFPNIEIRGLTPHMQQLNSQFLKRRLTQCGAIHHNKLALWDHLIGGCGDAYITMDDGRAVVRWADSLDMLFDQTARVMSDVRWKSLTVCQPLDIWIQTFGEAAFKSYIEKQPRSKTGQFQDMSISRDQPFELEFYYDMDSEVKAGGRVERDGNYMVFIKTGEGTWGDKPVYKGVNPNTYDIQGEKTPYLPFESIFFMMLPSVRLPSGAAEKALPAQIAVWRAARRIQMLLDKNPGFYEVPKGMDEKARAHFLESMLGGLVEVDEDMLGKIKDHPPMPITETDMEELSRNQQEMKRQLGASNYSMGEAEGGVKFAREVNAIQAQGSLVSGSIAKDNSDFWTRWIPKYLAKSKDNDIRRITLRIDGQQMDFGPQDPINQYLVPDADFVISEDSMRFIPLPQKVAQAASVLEISMNPIIAARFPNAIDPAFRKYLEANGIENIEERMKPPQMQPGMPGSGMPPPGAPAPGVPGQPTQPGYPAPGVPLGTGMG